MIKSLVLIAIVLFCAQSLHMQTYAPSTPGGYYSGTNGTASTNYNYNNQYPNTNTNTVPGVYVNGAPYYYTGPFTLVCYNVGSTTSVYRYDSCRDAYSCANLLNDYRNCRGTVKKYAL
jgi:hypothetical protein